MLTLGLTVDQQEAYHALLATHHTIDIRLQIMDMNHGHVSDIADRLIDGQVTIDADAEVTRSLDIDLLDPDGGLQLDSDSPNDGALFADRMLRVVYRIVNPLGTVSYSAPVFTGPITKLSRTGALLQVECMGKEVIGLSQAWNRKTYTKNTRVTTAIKSILIDIMGELSTKVKVPDRDARLPKPVSVGGDNLPWPTAKKLAAGIGLHLYYDGNGVAQVRPTPNGKAVFTFRQGETVKTAPDAGFSLENTVNAVEIWGRKPKKGKGKKGKNRPHAKLIAPRTHSLSPYWPDGLGRPGGPRFLPKVIEDDSLRTDADAKKRAKLELSKGLLEGVEVSYDTLVIPHLEEMDIVRIETDGYAANHRLRQFAIPLTASGDSSIGYVKKVTPNNRAIRARRRSRVTEDRKRSRR